MSLYNDQPFHVPCLGRPMELGMLYDCRTESVIPGVTLWNRDTLRKYSDLQYRPRNEFDVITEDSLDKKAYSLNIDASVKLSFLGGLISVEGSAKYLDNKKTSHQQARLSLTYKSNTYFEQLTMDQLATENIQYKDVFDKGTATHVITGVIYGADAVFVFDRQLSSNENIRNVEGSLKASIDKIPLISVEGKAKVQLNEEEAKENNKFRCTFHGDVDLETNPVTFEEAIEMYRSLPQYIKKQTLTGSGKDTKHGVPKRAYLYPLSKLDSKAARLVRIISNSLVDETQAILEAMSGFQITAKDLNEGTISQRFPGIQTQIAKCKSLVSRQVTDIQRSLADVLPKIRGGGAEESILADVIVNLKRSPFAISKLKAWLEGKKQEASILEQRLKSLKTCTHISKAGELEKYIYNGKVVALCFGSVAAMSHPYLEMLEQYLRDPQSVSTSDESYDEHWFDDEEIVRYLSKQICLVSEFTQANKEDLGIRYLVIAIQAKKSTKTAVGDTILYTDGIGEVYQLPSPPGRPEVSDFNGKDELELKWDAPKTGSKNVLKYIISYKIAYEDDTPNNWFHVECDSSNLHCRITPLQQNTPYVFKVAGLCEAGQSGSSKLSRAYSTSGPQKVFQTPSAPGKPWLINFDTKEGEIEIEWKMPDSLAESVHKYCITFRTADSEDTQNNWSHLYSESNETHFRISDLQQGTKYIFKISAISEGGKGPYSKESEPLSTEGEEENEQIRLMRYWAASGGPPL